LNKREKYEAYGDTEVVGEVGGEVVINGLRRKAVVGGGIVVVVVSISVRLRLRGRKVMLVVVVEGFGVGGGGGEDFVV
jgi:hypothetical protein